MFRKPGLHRDWTDRNDRFSDEHQIETTPATATGNRLMEYATRFPDATVLVIDDTASNLQFLGTILSMAGYRNIHSLSDPLKAATAYNKLKPDVVLLDLKMPGLDGFQVMELFKQIDHGGFIPVLMLTAEESKSIKLRALHAGVKDFLNKPFDRLEVLLRINNLIETHNLYKSLKEKNQSLDDAVRDRTFELQKEIRVRQQAEEHIRHQSMHDSLTGLPNRTLLRDRLQQDIYNARRHGKLLSVILIDIGRFREINNTLGHHNGDNLLMQIGNRLQTALRQGDTVSRFERLTEPETIARIGGDAFAIILPMLPTAESGMEIVGRMRDVFTRPFDINGFMLEVGVRISIVNFPEHGDDSETLLQRADVAMYQAKRTHQDCLLYSSDFDDFSTFRLTLMGELRNAIINGGLTLYYQPKIDISNNAVTGFEALVRWIHPEHGYISPDQFIPMAEETGMIKLLSEWVLINAIQQSAEFSKLDMPLTISVNLSAQDLLDRQLADKLNAILQESGIAPELITLEVTESAMMEDPENALEMITQISRLGIKFSIDDFGTGYSSLSYLKKLPVDEIKIDKSFVMDMENNPDDAVIVRSTIDLAHNLGRKVVAEGIEDPKILASLRKLGCDYGQGFYMSEPLPVDEILLWLDKTASKKWA
jgi:diguanylate cyclase (GGDEF)-like protein